MMAARRIGADDGYSGHGMGRRRFSTAGATEQHPNRFSAPESTGRPPREGRHSGVVRAGACSRQQALFLRDGDPQSYESAERKAFTAVSWNAPTSELSGRLEQTPNLKDIQQTPNLKDIPGTLFLGGGVPVAARNAPIAGIGVAGAPSGTLDEKYARAGAAVLDRQAVRG
jgi:uncharacterized protein GlcG (DUF336 family)